jgi:hypothetical protein
LTLNPSAKAAVHDIEDEKFWKCLYVLLRAVFPALRALRYCDSNTPVMDKLFFLSHRASEAIKKSEQFFSEVGLFSTEGVSDVDLLSEMEQVSDSSVGDTGNYAALVDENNGNDDDNADAADDDDEEEEEDESNDNVSDDDSGNSGFSFGSKLVWHWEHRRVKLEHPYAIMGWALCVMDDVRQDVNARLNGDHRNAMEMVIKRLHLPPCPNLDPEVSKMSEAQIVDVF